MKKNIILILILAVLGSGYLLISSDPYPNIGSNNVAYPFDFANLDYSKIKYFESGKGGYEISKDGDKYFIDNLSGSGKVATKSGIILTVIDDLKKTKFESIAARKKESWKDFDISDDGSSLKIGNTKIFMGKNDGYARQFIGVPGDNNVYSINKYISIMIGRGYENFKEEENVLSTGTGDVK